MDGGFLPESKRKCWGRTYSVDPKAEAEWGEPQEPILALPSRVKVYRRATDFLRR